MDISKYIGETTAYDKKQEVEHRKVKSWLKSVSAFANGNGGRLLFGIADDGSVVGLDDAKADAEFVSQKIKERIDPVPQITMTIEREEGKDMLLLDVHAGEDTPYYYMGDGVLETFVRIGNESVVADATDHKRLVLRGRNTSFDARPSDEQFSDYAFTKLCARYYSWNGVSFDSKLYRSFGLVDTKGILTNAGLLMSDDCPIRQSRVFCTRWNGNTKAGGTLDAQDSQEITGGLVTLLEDTMAFIRRNIRTIWYKTTMQRVEIPEYMERSVMEAVVNALAHRDYLITGSEVHVDMYSDRMVIYSPGAMPEGRIVQEMNLENIPSVRRNPLVADILAQLGYMERKGSGIGKIVNPIKALPYFTENMLPAFFSDRAQFAITFPNIIGAWLQEHPDLNVNRFEDGVSPNVTKEISADITQQLTDRQKDILDMISRDNTLTSLKLSQKMSQKMSQKVTINERTIKRDMATLQQLGILRREGGRKLGYWVINFNASSQ